MYQSIRIAFFAVVVLLLNCIGVKAQDDKNLQKEVQVVRPYEPVISDAFKINIQPKISDTVKVKPNFTYSIVPRPIIKSFAPRPISAAKMVAEPLTDSKTNYLRLGFGNHIMPMAELYYGSQRNKNWQYGMWLQHLSSFGDVKLQNDKAVEANLANTNVRLFGKRIFDEKMMLQGAVGFLNRQQMYYGYNYIDTAAKPTGDKQNLNIMNASIEFRGIDKDSAKLHYSTQVTFQHLGDAFDMRESRFQLLGSMDKYQKKEQFGGEFALTHYSRNPALDTCNNTLFMLTPWMNLFGKQWRVQVGFVFNLDARAGRAKTYFYPRAYLSYNIVSDYLIPYIEIDGLLEENPYAKIINENPWITPGLDVLNTSHKMILRGGLKGKFSSQVAYNVLASYSLADSMYFYKNISIDATNPLLNRFGVDYDNVEMLKAVGELTIAPTSRLNILLHAEYLNYKLKKLPYAWHKPSYTAFGSVRYNIKDKLITTLQLYMTGESHVYNPKVGESPIVLGGNFDLNLGFEYIYNRRLSAFLNINNLTAHKNNYWYLYPTHRFNVQGGLTFSF